MGFWHNLAPMTTVTIDKIVFHVLTNIAPSVQDAALRMRELVDDHITPVVEAGIDSPLASLHQNFGDKFEKVSKVTSQTKEEAALWVAANPGKTAILVTSGMVLFAPGLVTGPVLGALGFGAEGVSAGSLAAGTQAGLGNVSTGSSFAILQSAGSGGLGSVTVHGAVRSITGLAWGSAAAEVVVEVFAKGRKEISKL